jgi:hypothetical protein
MHTVIGQAMLRNQHLHNDFRAGRFDLFGLNGRISPGDWNSTIKPGLTITMRMQPVATVDSKRRLSAAGQPSKSASRTEVIGSASSFTPGVSCTGRKTSEIGSMSSLKPVASKIIQGDESNEQPATSGGASETRRFSVFDFLDEGQVPNTAEVASTAKFSPSPFNVFEFLEDKAQRAVALLSSEARLKEIQSNRPRTSVLPRPASTPLLNMAQASPSKSQDHKAQRWPKLRFIPFISRSGREEHKADKIDRASLPTNGQENVLPAPNSPEIRRTPFKDVTDSAKPPQASRLRWSESNKKDADITPIFTWHIDPSPADALQNSASRSPTSTRHPPGSIGDDIHDRPATTSSRHETLREILIEADEEAGRLLQNNEDVREYFDAVPDRGRMHIDAAKANIEERAQRPATWEKQKHVVTEAMRLMDAFVTPHEHERSELEAAFCGAMVEILEGEVGISQSLSWNKRLSCG